MRVFTRVAVTISLLTLAAVEAAVTAGSSSAASDVVGHLYVDDNTAGTNTIAAFDRHAIVADGSLSLLGSTSLGAASVGAEDARLAPDGATLWVVDTRADAVSAFAVNGGDLTGLPSSPTPLPAGAAPFGIVV